MDNNLLKTIRDKALSDFPNDYETALFQMENQTQAVNDINNFRDDEVPNNILFDTQKKELLDFKKVLYQIKS